MTMKTEEQITSAIVPEGKRLSFMPKHFGRRMMQVETHIFNCMGRLCKEYNGGYWKFVELSNGGAYLALDSDKPMRLVCVENYFEGEMSAEAAGIVVTLFALSALSFQAGAQQLAEKFHLLRDFALEHAEASQILAAID